MLRIAVVLGIFLGIILAYEVVSIANEDVAVVVDRVTGQFAIGDIGGLALIEGYPSNPHYTHVCLRVNSSIFSNDTALGTEPLVLRDTADVYENTISITWNAGRTRLWEKFYTLDYDSLRGFIYIEYLLYNDSPDSVIAGILEYMDVRVGDNDAPTISIPGSLFTTERGYDSTNMPAYWTLFRNYGDTVCDVAQCVPFGREMIYVDKAMFTDVTFGNAVTWDFTPLERPISDLSILMRWDERPINAFETYIVGHYYGIGYPGADIEELLAKHPPSRFVFGAPYPNPTNAAANIKVEILNHPQNIELHILSLDGRQIATLHDGVLECGSHIFRWNLDDFAGNAVPSGIYFAALTNGANIMRRAILVIK